ncbi:hypothetical protein B0H14DRAFT_2644297 [Mycena olivaceomarginata]|nr:hypothetical protein B0H14DRAFT_2644297 [Mycena olivaceomarginata]
MPAANHMLLPSWHAPNVRHNAIGNGPNPRGSGLCDSFPHTWFGLKKSEQGGHRLLVTDYRVKYTEDPPYKEMDEEAHVWHVYNDKSEIFYNNMVIKFSDNLDILLVFYKWPAASWCSHFLIMSTTPNTPQRQHKSERQQAHDNHIMGGPALQ